MSTRPRGGAFAQESRASQPDDGLSSSRLRRWQRNLHNLSTGSVQHRFQRMLFRFDLCQPMLPDMRQNHWQPMLPDTRQDHAPLRRGARLVAGDLGDMPLPRVTLPPSLRQHVSLRVCSGDCFAPDQISVGFRSARPRVDHSATAASVTTARSSAPLQLQRRPARHDVAPLGVLPVLGPASGAEAEKRLTQQAE